LNSATLSSAAKSRHEEAGLCVVPGDPSASTATSERFGMLADLFLRLRFDFRPDAL